MDWLSYAILVVLILAFGFLTWRAWGSKNKILKWVGTILAGLLTIILALGLGAAITGSMKVNQNYNASHPVVPVTVAMTPENLARGEKLAKICAGCHSGNGQLPLSGNDFLGADAPPIGTLYAPNLTPSGNIADWSDGEVIRAIREGVHKNGRSLIIMPSGIFKNMSDNDAQALVAYLRSQPPTGSPSPETKLSLIGGLFLGNLATDALTVQPHITQPIVAPPEGPTKEYGEYLVGVTGCRDCHGQNLTGGTAAESNEKTPNLTLIIPQWSQEQFMTFFRTGALPSGGTVGEAMPWQEYNNFASDADLKALYEYLHSLPASQ